VVTVAISKAAKGASEEVKGAKWASPDLPSRGTAAGLEMVAIVAALSLAVIQRFLRAFAVAIRRSPRVFAIAIRRSLRELFRTLATFVASARRVPTPVLVPAPSAVLVQVELNEVLLIGAGPASAEAEASVEGACVEVAAAASVEEARAAVEGACVEVAAAASVEEARAAAVVAVADVAADGIDDGPPSRGC
jgi:hypothetical protein